ncbi:MAG: hypothetical protein J4432_01005 [DPANN group archaeon]|nr:hypothetical protein [DPANN group archaeon]
MAERSKGQAAMMDALIFMLIASGAATLLIFAAGLVGSSTNEQLITIYNLQYANVALVAFFHGQDTNGDFILTRLSEITALTSDNTKISTDLTAYFENTGPGTPDGPGKDVFTKLKNSSPSSSVILCFQIQGREQQVCYARLEPGEPLGLRQEKIDSVNEGTRQVVSASAPLKEGVEVILKLAF